MKNFSYCTVMTILCFILTHTAHASMSDNVSGRILLQVEENGEAWYVLPDSGERFYLADGNIAYAALRTFGLGITNEDLYKIPVGLALEDGGQDSDDDGLSDQLEEALHSTITEPDSDFDGYDDKTEIEAGYNPSALGAMEFNYDLVERLKGQILLQIEDLGQAWYINPDDGKRYYMKDGDAAYEIMKYLSLGITNDDLVEIATDNSILNCGDSKLCIAAAVEKNYQVTGKIGSYGGTDYIFTNYNFSYKTTKSNPYEAEFIMEYISAYYTEEFYEFSYKLGKTDEEILATLNDTNNELAGEIAICIVNDKEALLEYIEVSDSKEEVRALYEEETASILLPKDFATCE